MNMVTWLIWPYCFPHLYEHMLPIIAFPKYITLGNYSVKFCKLSADTNNVLCTS